MALNDAELAVIHSLIAQRFGEGSTVGWAVERGLSAERPLRDGLTHAWGPLALRRGHLLRLPAPRTDEPATIRVHAVAIDIRGLIHMNDHHGFAVTDEALVRVARALAMRFGEREIVRVHGDAFAAIRSSALQSHERDIGGDGLRELEAELVEALRGPEKLTPVPERVTTIEVDLDVRGVRDAELLGTLVHAEIEAALCGPGFDGAPRRRTYDFR